ncbi:HIT-like protein [Lactarius indigo]|nr:HIT-like protein [Lactarius indigo]
MIVAIREFHPPRSLSTCIFCKIIKGEIPSYKLLETEFTFSFLDINPLSKGHSLVIPNKLHDVPDEYLADTLSIAKKIAIAQGAKDYNILQNNGRIAHQFVDHVHFHVIPKPSDSKTEGLVVEWPQQSPSQDELALVQAELKGKL